MIGDPTTTSLKPYSTYKATSMPWLKKVPETWEACRIKTIFRESQDRRGEKNLELLSLTRAKGLIPQSQSDNATLLAEDLSNYKVCHPSDIVMNRMQAWSGMFAVPRQEGVVSPDYSVFSPTTLGQIRFFEHLFKTPALVEQFAKYSKGIGSGFNRLYSEDFGDVRIPAPPPEEQDAIVQFLDHADEQIRRYTAGKERLIALLEEERQALVHQGVTRGLDPTVRIKPSGVEWLGEVPEHWSVQRLKTVCQMKSGEGITAMSIESEGEYPVYGGNGLRGYTSDFTHDGEHVLIGRQGALCGNVHVVEGRFWASEHAVVATPHPKYMVGWLGPVLEAMNLNQYSISAAQPGLAVERILNLWIVVPTQEEQSTVAEQIGEQATEIASTMAQARRQIDLMNEYRTRLIADVVTGQLDVREATAQLPGDVLGRTNPGS